MVIEKISWKFFILLNFFLISGSIYADGKNSDAHVAPQEKKNVFAEGLTELEKVNTLIKLHGDSTELYLNRLRLTYVLGVKEEKYLIQSEKDLAWLQSGKDTKNTKALLLAYEGAIQVAHAKHGFNFPRKWENLKKGIPLLDSAITMSPKEPEPRYLRLVSNYYLPFFMGRKPKVKEDFAALAQTLPGVTQMFPPKWYVSIAKFVVENGDLAQEEIKNLEVCILMVSKGIPE